jgi:hypothetical protein
MSRGVFELPTSSDPGDVGNALGILHDTAAQIAPERVGIEEDHEWFSEDYFRSEQLLYKALCDASTASLEIGYDLDPRTGRAVVVDTCPPHRARFHILPALAGARGSLPVVAMTHISADDKGTPRHETFLPSISRLIISTNGLYSAAIRRGNQLPDSDGSVFRFLNMTGAFSALPWVTVQGIMPDGRRFLSSIGSHHTGTPTLNGAPIFNGGQMPPRSGNLIDTAISPSILILSPYQIIQEVLHRTIGRSGLGNDPQEWVFGIDPADTRE